MADQCCYCKKNDAIGEESLCQVCLDEYTCDHCGGLYDDVFRKGDKLCDCRNKYGCHCNISDSNDFCDMCSKRLNKDMCEECMDQFVDCDCGFLDDVHCKCLCEINKAKSTK
jgi:hypothetical protein